MAKQEIFSCFTVEILDSDTWDTPSHPRLDPKGRGGLARVAPRCHPPDSPKDGVRAKTPPPDVLMSLRALQDPQDKVLGRGVKPDSGREHFMNKRSVWVKEMSAVRA